MSDVVQVIFVMLHDLHLNGVSLLRQQSQLSQVNAARPELVFCIVTVLSCTHTHASQRQSLISRAAVGMEIPMGMGMGNVINPHGSVGIL